MTQEVTAESRDLRRYRFLWKPLCRQGADIGDKFSCSDPALALQEHGHVNGQVGYLLFNTYIVVAQDESFGDAVILVKKGVQFACNHRFSLFPTRE